MTLRIRLLCLAIAASVTVVAAGPHRGVTHPQVRCALPDRDYQYRTYSQPVQSVSAVGVLVRQPLTSADMTESEREKQRWRGDPTTLRAVKAFQFVERPRLEIDHCSISRISLQLYETGDWTLTLRADQNPVRLEPPAVDRQVTTAEEREKFTDHLKRNSFVVNLRCYARDGETGDDSAVGKPVVIPLEVQPFWVQAQEPRWYADQGNHPQIRQFFEFIDRVEIEFSYGNRGPLGAERVSACQGK